MFINVYPFLNSRWDLHAPADFPAQLPSAACWHQTWVSDVWFTTLGHTVVRVTSPQLEPMLESSVAQGNHLADAGTSGNAAVVATLSQSDARIAVALWAELSGYGLWEPLALALPEGRRF